MPRQVDATGRRDAIAAATMAVVRQEGFAAVTVRRVADQLGTSTTAVTHYLRSRDDLVRLAVGGLLAQRRADAERAVAGADHDGALRSLIEWATSDVTVADQRVWLDLVSGGHTDPVLRELLDEFNAWWDTMLARMAARWVKDRCGDLSARQLADVVAVIVDGTIVAAFEGQPWSSTRVARTRDLLLAPLGLVAAVEQQATATRRAAPRA